MVIGYIISECSIIFSTPIAWCTEMGTEPDPERIQSPATFFGSGAGFEFLGKSGILIRYECYGVLYIECM